RQIIAFLAGYAFGLLTGTLLGTLAALLGCLVTFLYARLFGRRLLRDRLGRRAARFDRFVHEHPFSMTLLIRLLPIGSNILTNLVAGVSSARMLPFLAASFIGAASLLFLASGMLGAYLYHRHRHGLSFDDRIDAALGEVEQS
ncbi:MAG: VTT domain-containing protein, partial [Pseudomonadales bacterium]